MERKNQGYELDSVDYGLLEKLQKDASISNQALAAQLNISPATCMRRVQRLKDKGVIEKYVAIVSPDRLGASLLAIVEITLDQQSTEYFEAFEQKVESVIEVQQCYRVSSGPDFILMIHVQDMPAYQALANRLFNTDGNVRNVRTFFAVRRSKFGCEISMPRE